jgi:hypothetical protein
VNLRKRRANSGGAQGRFVNPAPGAAVGEFAVNNYSRDAADAVLFSLRCHIGLVHIQDLDFARVTRNLVDCLNGLDTRRAPGAKDFDFSFTAHDYFPSLQAV